MSTRDAEIAHLGVSLAKMVVDACGVRKNPTVTKKILEAAFQVLRREAMKAGSPGILSADGKQRLIDFMDSKVSPKIALTEDEIARGLDPETVVKRLALSITAAAKEAAKSEPWGLDGSPRGKSMAVRQIEEIYREFRDGNYRALKREPGAQ